MNNLRIKNTGCVVFQLDGTLTLRNKDSEKIDNIYLQKINIPIIEILFWSNKAGYEVIICSERFESEREKIKSWLDLCDIPYSKLYLRNDSDMFSEKDYRIKIWNELQKEKSIFFTFENDPNIFSEAEKLGIKAILS